MKPIIAVPAILAIVYRAWSRNSLTSLGLLVAAATAVVHATHPWGVFFALLGVFFLAGTAVTKVKHDVKARLTYASSGGSGGEGPRTHVQVLANSAVASVLCIIHTYILSTSPTSNGSETCWLRGSWPRSGNVLVAGIVANYAAVAADTFSSELGILSHSAPRLITAPWRTVPPGTNGGVTATGLLAGTLGAFIISVTAAVLMPFCPSTTQTMWWDPRAWLSTDYHAVNDPGWPTQSRLLFIASMTAIGLAGSLLDSLMGAVLQASVVDLRSGKIVEGNGGAKVPVHSPRRSSVGVDGSGSGASTSASPKRDEGGTLRSRGDVKGPSEDGKSEGQPSRKVQTGHDILSNNGVNIVMALSMSVVGILGACLVWDAPLSSIIP